MNLINLKTEILAVLEARTIHLHNFYRRAGMIIKDDAGVGEYILINRLENHYVIELLGFQNITNNPKFVIEDKSNNSDINFFINGGKKYDEYNGLKPIIDLRNAHSYEIHTPFSDLIMSVETSSDMEKILSNDLALLKTRLIKVDCDLPFHFALNTTNIVLNEVAIVSQVNNVFSFRKHANTIIIRKDIPFNFFRGLIKTVFNTEPLNLSEVPVGIKLKSHVISELKSLAYHKVDETAIDKFIQLISDDFAKALGYVACLSNIRLEIQENPASNSDKKFLSPDFLMQKKDGTYDILDLKLGLLTADFAFGDWTNSHFSSYAQKLLGQLAGYRRYFSNKKNAIWAFKNLGIKVERPRLIGIAGNHNNFNRLTVDTALEGNIDDFEIISYNELADLLNK